MGAWASHDASIAPGLVVDLDADAAAGHGYGEVTLAWPPGAVTAGPIQDVASEATYCLSALRPY